MMNFIFIKKGKSKKTSDCCGVEIKEVEQDSSCCGVEESQENSCCGVDEPKQSSCC